ncbi:MAG: right-handed parallel beta-helix repeat-containing protein, partial [bacterium]
MKERRRQVGLISCFGFLFVISVQISLAQTEVSGKVAGVWTLLESPFIVKDDISVSIGDTLRIEPGVKILFDGHFEFSIKGLLQAAGTDADSITFTHKAPDSTWAGIRFSEADKNSILEYCTIEYSDQSGITVFKSSITVKYNTIRNNQDIGSQFQVGMGGGIYVSFSAPLIAGNYIVNNSAERGGGIEYNEDGTPNRCEILNNIIVSNSASTLG